MKPECKCGNKHTPDACPFSAANQRKLVRDDDRAPEYERLGWSSPWGDDVLSLTGWGEP